MPPGEIPVQPCFRHLQFTMDGGLRNSERRGSFVVGQPSKKQEFDELALPGIVLFEALQRFVQFWKTWREQLGGTDQDVASSELDMCRALRHRVSGFCRPSGIVHQNMLRITRAATAKK